jgi:hypothetical protein
VIVIEAIGGTEVISQGTLSCMLTIDVCGFSADFKNPVRSSAFIFYQSI